MLSSWEELWHSDITSQRQNLHGFRGNRAPNTRYHIFRHTHCTICALYKILTTNPCLLVPCAYSLMHACMHACIATLQRHPTMLFQSFPPCNMHKAFGSSCVWGFTWYLGLHDMMHPEERGRLVVNTRLNAAGATDLLIITVARTTKRIWDAASQAAGEVLGRRVWSHFN